MSVCEIMCELQLKSLATVAFVKGLPVLRPTSCAASMMATLCLMPVHVL